MKKADLIEFLAWQAAIPRYKAARALRALVFVINRTLRKGGALTIWGIGTFRVRDCEFKEVQSFDGRWYASRAGRKVSFLPSRSLKRAARARPQN